MKYFRNPAMRIDLVLHLILWIISFFLGRQIHSILPVMFLAVLYTLLHFGITLCRYHTIERFSRTLDQILQHQETLHPGDYQEGELGILEDQISKLTLRLRDQAEALKADKEYLSDALADISHQLRTPLTSMNLSLAILKKSEISIDERRHCLMQLDQLLRHIDWLVSTLLRISQLDAGTISMQNAEISVHRLIHKALSPFDISMELHNQQLIADIPNGLFLIGDAFWLSEAISNIFKNCTEHIPDGGHIFVHGQENPLYTELRIEDDGPGFSEKDLPHIFDRFYKGRESAAQNYGIGLALAKQIVIRHSGVLTASNRPEGGACFTLRIYKSDNIVI